MIYALDQLNGLVDVVYCPTCKGKAAIVFLNDIPDVIDLVTGKKAIAKPALNYKVTCDLKAGTHRIEQ